MSRASSASNRPAISAGFAVMIPLSSSAGYSSIWNLVEVFEGGKNKDGARAINGWRNAGLPWSYKIPTEAAWVPAVKWTV